MSLFQYSDKKKAYSAEINGIRICCKEANNENECKARALAEAYEDQIPELVSFMLDEVCSVYGDMTGQELLEALGTPEIDIDREMVSFLEHTLDDCHIIDVEYGGLLETFYEVIIDG